MNDPHFIWHYDGKTAICREAILTVTEGGFDVAADGLPLENYAWADLVYRGEKSGGPYYGHISRPGWQIGLTDPLPDALFARLPKPKRYGGFIDRVGLVPASVILVAASAALIFGVTKVPEVVAPLVPMSWERNLGDAMIGDMGGRFCQTRDSRKALDVMTARLNSKGDPIEINIANINMVNAVALPGGKVVIFRGLLQEAKNADELAGVLGHEIGHVRNRDVMQSLLRQTGLSILLGGANTNAAGALNTLVSSRFSREAEAAADDYSIKLMQKAAISPDATAGFFERLSGDEKKMGKAAAALGYLSSHPVSASREKAFRASKQTGVAHTPVVTPEQWRAIVDACANDPDVEDGTGLPF